MLTPAGAPFRWVDAEDALDELKRANPLAQVPTLLLEDGTVMTESAAILIWLGLRYPASGLLPAQPAQAIRGLVFIAANCYAAIGVIDYPERFCADCDKATGERLGALDLLAAVVSRWSGGRAHLAAARPAFHALLQRVEADPRIAGIFARHWPPQG